MQKSATKSIKLVASLAYHRCEEGEKIGFYLCLYGALEGEIVVGQMDVTMDIPDDLDELTVNQKFIDAMREEQEKLKSETQIKVGNIEEKIQSLLALPAPNKEKAYQQDLDAIAEEIDDVEFEEGIIS